MIQMHVSYAASCMNVDLCLYFSICLSPMPVQCKGPFFQCVGLKREELDLGVNSKHNCKIQLLWIFHKGGYNQYFKTIRNTCFPPQGVFQHKNF